LKSNFVEREAIAALFCDPSFKDAAGCLSKEDFVTPVAAAIFEKHQAGKSSLSDFAGEELEFIVASLRDYVAQSPLAIVNAVRFGRRRRELDKAARGVLRSIRDGAPIVEVEDALKALLSRPVLAEQSPPDIAAIAEEAKTIEDGVKWDVIPDIELSGLTFVVARPGHGKTTLLLNLLLDVVKTRPVLFFTLEVDAGRLLLKLLSIVSRLPFGRVKKALLDGGADAPAVEVALEKLRAMNERLWLMWGIFDVSDLVACVEAVCGRGEKPAVLIDYIQLLHGDRAERRYLEIAGVADRLRRLSITRHIPVICAAQASRPAKGEEDGMPSLSSLRECGNLEQDATVILGLKSPPSDPVYHDAMDVEVLKNRYGVAGGVFSLKFHKPFGVIEPRASKRDEDGVEIF